MLINKFLSQLPFETITGWSLVSGEYETSLVVKPLNVTDDGTELTEGTVGSLATGEWGYAAGKLYVKDNPGVIKASQPILLSSILGSDIMCLSIMINNCEDTDANIILIISDGFSVAKTISLETIDDDYSFDGFVLESLDRVEVMSNKENVNALMSISYTEVD